MNRIHQSVWSNSSGTFVAVSENAGGASKKKSSSTTGRPSAASFAVTALSACLMLGLGASVYALPTGGVVAAGGATIDSGASKTTITQSTASTVINWQSFGIAAGQTVQFVQPGSTSVALNRVTGTDASNIMGSLQANGRVFLLNPNGVLFGSGASVNVGGLVASTMSLSDAKFMAGDYGFTDAGSGSVVNQGNITVTDGGFVALMGKTVSNQGVISARLGSVALAAGNAVTMDVAGDGLLNVSVAQGAVNALVENGGLIRADGGNVLLTAQAAGNLLQTAVNNTGVIQAQTIGNRNGTILLLGDMQSGTMNVSGTLDASAPNGGNGGFIETSAANVKIPNDVKVTTAAPQGLTGTWLIDPADYTIAASGGDITGAQLSANLVNNNVIIMSSSGAAGVNGDIIVADTVNWSANKLTLNAQRNININTAMNGSGTASLSLLYGQGAVATGNTATYNVLAPINLPEGPNFTTQLGFNGVPVNYTVLTNLGGQGSVTATDLQGMNGNRAGNYALGSDINANATSGWGGGFAPIGNTIANPFSGNFDGLGHTITGLTIARPLTDNVGLFGYVVSTPGAMLKNVTLSGGSVTGGSYVGTLVGHINGDILNSHSNQNVVGASYVGGLVGWSTGNITNSSTTGRIDATGDYIGGLVGWITGNITCCFATGPVTSNGAYVGGLAGWITGDASRSYASGAVSTQGAYVGGLLGWSTGNTSNSYARGSVFTAGANAGGLVGWIAGTSNIINSYSAGRVTGVPATTGGLVGQKIAGPGTVSNSYWDTQTSMQATSAGGVGMTTSNMMIRGNYTGWDFTNIWIPPTGVTYPSLQACLVPATWSPVPALPPIQSLVPGITPTIIPGAGIINPDGSTTELPYVESTMPVLATLASYRSGLMPTYMSDAGDVFFVTKEEEVVAPTVIPFTPPPPYIAPRYAPRPARN